MAKATEPKMRGFAAMKASNPARQKEIAAKGGRASSGGGRRKKNA